MTHEAGVDHYALVDSDTSLVTNVIVWDGTSEFDAGEGVLVVPLPYVEDEDGERRYTGGIGWTHDDGEFTDNRPEPDPNL